MDRDDFEKAFKVTKEFEKLSPFEALTVLGMCIDIAGARNGMTGPEVLDYMRPHVEAVYAQFGEYVFDE